MLAGGATMFRASKDQFVNDVRDNLLKANPNITQAQWDEARSAIENDADLYAMWEAVPEAVGNMVTLGLLNNRASRFIPKLNLIKSTIARKIAGGTIKTAADMASEILFEGVTQMGQMPPAARQGLVPPEQVPETLGEAVGQIAAPVALGTALTMGMGSAVRKVADGMTRQQRSTPAPEPQDREVAAQVANRYLQSAGGDIAKAMAAWRADSGARQGGAAEAAPGSAFGDTDANIEAFIRAGKTPDSSFGNVDANIQSFRAAAAPAQSAVEALDPVKQADVIEKIAEAGTSDVIQPQPDQGAAPAPAAVASPLPGAADSQEPLAVSTRQEAPPSTDSGFDSAAWNKAREATIKASKDAVRIRFEKTVSFRLCQGLELGHRVDPGLFSFSAIQHNGHSVHPEFFLFLRLGRCSFLLLSLIFNTLT
jgi:hypothetical protein